MTQHGGAVEIGAAPCYRRAMDAVVSDVHAALLDEYEQVSPLLASRGQALCAALIAWLHDAGIKVHSVTARVKDRASLARKLARPDRSYRSLWDVTDVLGLRVITYFEDAVDHVGQLLEGHLAIDLARSIDKRRRDQPAAFGYRSLHYVFGLQLPLADGGLPPTARCEVQVRTLLEHTWAEIEHDLGYKAPGAVPVAVRRRLSRLAGMLEVADLEFVAIRNQLDEYAQTLPRRIAAAGEDIALDALSLAALVDCPEVRALDARIAAELVRDLGDDTFFPDYLLKMLALVGFTSVAEVRASVADNCDAVVAMARPYFQFAWSAWRLSPADMERLLRGYALFFVAHVHLLRGPGLQLDKVERLARLYRELDYPDDEHAAQRIAGMLVDTFKNAALRVIA